jgi:UDPglucose 6-dehydrogenase
MSTVGIVGLGAVGGTVARCFDEAGVPTRRYDRYLSIGAASDLSDCSVIFVCVPTPIDTFGALDATEVWSAVKEIEPLVAVGTIFAVKSTVPPGTGDELAAAFARVAFASVPEFLVAARPTETFTRPDRVVIGAFSPEAAATISGLMSAVAPSAPIVVLRPIEAELVKLCANAMLATKVTLANELAEICSRFDVQWPRVKTSVGLDRRIGPDHLDVSPERGFGGGCLPKDLDGLINASRQAGYEPSILDHIAGFNRWIRGERQRPPTTPADRDDVTLVDSP